MGYYDYHAARALGRPIVLAAQVGVPVTQVAIQLAARSGLPCTDLLRAVEHRRGCSVRELVERAGLATYRDAETRLLGELLGQRPAGIISLAPGTLEDPRNRRAVAEQSVLVHLMWPLAELGAQLRARDAPELWPWIETDGGATDLALRLAAQEEALDEAPLAVAMADRTVDAVVEELLGLFGLHPA